MKNFKKRFCHAANHTYITTAKISLSKRKFMGFNIFAFKDKDLGVQYIHLPIRCISKRYRQRHIKPNYKLIEMYSFIEGYCKANFNK